MDWSDDGDGRETYARFKNRKKEERKNVAANTRRMRAAMKKDKIPAGKNDGKKKRLRDLANGEGSSDGGSSKSKKRKDETTAAAAGSNDDFVENAVPEYLQERRARFEKRLATLRGAGLKLPPCYDEVEFSDDDRLRDLVERPNFSHATPSQPYADKQLPTLGLIPAPISQWLRDYQIEGTMFLHSLFVHQKGGILGDDMGLGKTVQVIAFLTAAFGKTGDERDAKRMRKMRRAGNNWYPRVLIVCPGTLIENWRAELKRWGWWHVDVYHGGVKEGAIDAAAAGRIEIMITTYATYRMNKSAINLVEWDCVVADECHVIKGRKSETTKAMNEVNALCRIGLTGTAIQNSYDELWTLLNWTNPGKLGPIATWTARISEPLKTGQSHDATVFELSKARKTAKALVDNLLPRFFLRRMKTIIADQLPKKSDRVVFCPLTDTQINAYENLVDSDVIHYIRTSADPCTCGSGKRSGWCCNILLPDGGKWQSHVFPAILNLQKLSNHLAILIPQGSDPKDKQDKDLEMLQITIPDQWRDLYRNRDSIVNYSNPEFCGKWKILKKLLRFWHANGDKVLVFSHSVRLLRMLQMLFMQTSYNICYLDGKMSYEDRAKAVDDFNSDSSQFVFLISTKAGGVGLNITSANKVVVVDPNWNPSYDLQAQDRAYRIGQVRDVEVFRLISAGTIEEIVYARQIYKQQQANIGYTASNERRYFKGVQENKDQKGEIFGLANLFAFQENSIVLRDIVNKTNVAEYKAGVAVVGLDLDEAEDDPLTAGGGDEEDSAMSQIAAFVEAGGDEAIKRSHKRSSAAQKSDPVQAILASVGVEYTHENSEVIGSSRVEAGLSRRALQAEKELCLTDERMFPATQDADADRPQAADEEKGETNEQIKWKYHPPQEVMKRQLCTMAQTFDFEDPVQFALVVEGWTQAQRRSCLDRFYRIRREKLAAEVKG